MSNDHYSGVNCKIGEQFGCILIEYLLYGVVWHCYYCNTHVQENKAFLNVLLYQVLLVGRSISKCLYLSLTRCQIHAMQSPAQTVQLFNATL